MFSEVIVTSKCGPLARIEKQAMSSKLDQPKRSTRISGQQLRIKNQIMATR